MLNARILLAATPRGDMVLAIDGDLDGSPTSQAMAKLLADTCFKRENITIDGLPVIRWLRARLDEAGIKAGDLGFGEDVHQCVFLGDALQRGFHESDPAKIDQMACDILYRGTVPFDSGSLLDAHFPHGLNNPGNTFSAHGRGVSIFSGWAASLENSFILMAMSTVSALGVLRLCRHKAFDAMERAQAATTAVATPRNARSLISDLSDRLNEMQLDLSFGVESYVDPILVPEMVVEAFRRSLSEAVGLKESLENTSRMLERVDTVISARLSKLEALDRDRIERRDRLIAILVATASLLALPPALLLAFFGVSSPEVHSGDSIFDLHTYWEAYALAWLPFIVLASVSIFFYFRIQRGRERAGRP